MDIPLRKALLTAILFMPLFMPERAFAAVESTKITLNAKRVAEHTLMTPTTGIAFSLGETANNVEVQTKENGVWSSWRKIRIDGDAEPWERDSDLLFTDNATAVRMRSSENSSVILHAISVEKDRTTSLEAAAGRSLTPAPVIIPRWQWGADEKLRISSRGEELKTRAFYTSPELVMRCDRRAYLYPEEFREKNRKFSEDVDGDGKEETLLWPIGYSDKIDIVVIHHTAEDSPTSLARSDIERMRTVYAYHAVARGWGDIGYNYVIGPSGMIFEGRAGGDFAVGAHTYCNNVGAIGISLMGNFQTGKPTDAQLTALRWLLVYAADKYKINTNDKTIYHGKTMPTIVGHRDVGQTACPGNYSYELLPQVRFAAKERSIDTPLFSTAAAPSNVDEAALTESLLPLRATMGQSGKISVRYMNVGSDTWDKNTWLLAQGDPGMYFTRVRPFSFVAGSMREPQAKPGEVATFDVDFQAGLSPKNGAIVFTPVINNTRRLIKNTVQLAFSTEQASPRFTYVTSYFPPLHKTGEDLAGTLKLINSGTVPWEKNSLTEIGFDIDGGTGEVTILSEPGVVAPGDQASFRLNIQNVEEDGPYKRVLLPRFAEGSPLVGESITLASRAEPIPDIAFSSSHGSAPTLVAMSANTSVLLGNAVLEALAGTDLTLAPREQAPIPLRIRTGKKGISRYEDLAIIVRSNPTIVLSEEKSVLRMRNTLRSPVTISPYQSQDIILTLLAPKTEGDYTFSIGDLNFTLTVRPHGKYLVQTKSSDTLMPRNVRQDIVANRITERRTLRTERLARRAPPQVRRSQVTDIRIKLSYGKNSAIITSPSTMRIDGSNGIISSNGPAQLSMEQGLCKVSTANGNLMADVLRFAPTDERGFLTIMTQEKSTNRFRGVLECRIIDDKLVLVNELGIEDYIAGLAEEPDSEPWEKQRAFAVAARSYALFYVLSGQKKFPGKPYDGSDDPREFQAYGGLYFEESNPRWVQAAQDTAGQVIAWQRKIVKAPYFSSDTGQTKSASDVWGWLNTPYLDSKLDPWCKGMAEAGHGVGMSGCGAEGQANEGKIAEDILQYYYPGTHILPIEKVFEWEERMK